MRSEEELRQRLREAIEARKSLVTEELQAEDGADAALQHELSEEIENLSGVITTLEWVLQTSTIAEDEAWTEDEGDDGDDLIEIAEFSEGDPPSTIGEETPPAR